MTQFIRVASLADVPPGKAIAVKVDGKQIALFNVDGQVYALNNICTHRGGPLGEGRLRGKIVTCPWHGAQFDVTTGRIVSPPAVVDASIHTAKVEDGSILIEVV